MRPLPDPSYIERVLAAIEKHPWACFAVMMLSIVILIGVYVVKK